MRKTLTVAGMLVLICTANSFGTFLGQLRSAETLGWGSLNLMAGLGVYQDAFASFGTARYGIASPVDGSLSFALLNHSSSPNTGIVIGGDLQYRLAYTNLGSTLDMAIGAGVEYYTLKQPNDIRTSNLGVGVNFIASKPIKTGSDFQFTPYGRVNLRIDHTGVDVGSNSILNQAGIETGHSKLRMGLNVGSEFPVSSKIKLTGELQIDDQIAVIAGINFFMW